MRKILVTGGAGFIGSNFIRYWLKKYPTDKIINLDKLTYAGHLKSTKDFSNNKNYKFVKGDICNFNLVESVVKEVDIIVHFAAESHVDRSIRDPKIFVKTNVEGTQVLMEAALKHKISRFHHVSTDEVFGSLPLGGGKFSEDSCYSPRSPYAASKAASDHLVRAYYETFGLPITITNCSNNFGPYQHPEKMIPRSIINLIQGGWYTVVYGDGKHVRDWLYVEDHVRGIDFVLDKGKIGDSYLMGGLNSEINNLELVSKLEQIFAVKAPAKSIEDRLGNDRRYAVDWSKIKKELGWEPKYGFDSGLAITVDWYKNNVSWWQPLV